MVRREGRRRRRNSAALSGKMCFSVTMAFLIHNLSHWALWEMCCLFLKMAGQNQSWFIVGLAFTVSFTCMSSVYLNHQEGQAHKKKTLTDVWQAIGHLNETPHCLLRIFLIQRDFLCSKILQEHDKKKAICHSWFLPYSQSLFLKHLFILVPSVTSPRPQTTRYLTS